MSRLFVKNLPPSATPSTLRAHFSRPDAPNATITDVHLARRQDGSSRGFGFIGYLNEAQADQAREWFDKTFMGMSKIHVTIVKNDFKRKIRGEGEDQPNKKLKLDNTEQFDEFKKIMKPRNPDGPSWNNEDPSEAVPPVQVSAPAAAPEEEPENLTDLEWMRRRMGSKPEQEEQDPTKSTILQTSRLFVRNLSYACTQDDLQHLFQKFDNLTQVHIATDPTTSKSKGFAYITFSDPHSALRAYEELDKSSFQGRLLHVLGAVDKPGVVDDSTTTNAKKMSIRDQRSEDRKKTSQREFNWSMLYMNPDAIATSLSTKFSIPKSSILTDSIEDPTSSSINPAIKLALAETHIINETKSYLSELGVSFPSQTQTQTQAKAPTPRNKSIILIKNIPPSTNHEIRDLFQPFGDLKRVIVPPLGTIAIVEFGSEGEARDAWKGVAYRRMGSGVVYLEWGWAGMFDGVGTKKKVDDKKQKKGGDGPDAEGEEEEEEEEEVGQNSTLYIKNLSFSTTTSRLTSLFKGLPGFVFAKVMTKPNPSGETPLSMGFGFIGFRTTADGQASLSSLQGSLVDGRALEVKFAARNNDETGGTISSSIKPGGGGKGNKSKPKTKTSTKLIIKNLPFEVNKKDLRDLFIASNHTPKSLRLPTKSSHSSSSSGLRSRGFAFVDFASHAQAQRVVEELNHVHLLGRHLVFEWAEGDDNDGDEGGGGGNEKRLEEIRRKTGIGYGFGSEVEVGGRKGGFVIGKDGEDE